ncbi:MAG: DUF6605 domain-containing protein [Caldilineaceae bacterium]
MRFHWVDKAIYLFAVLFLGGSMARPLPTASLLKGSPSSYNRPFSIQRGAWLYPAKLTYGTLACNTPCSANQRRILLPARIYQVHLPFIAHQAPNPIQLENQLPGSTGWQLGPLVSDDINQQIQGFVSAVSVNKGQAISFYVTVHPSQPYTMDIYRMGWYGGKGGRLMQHIGPLAGIEQPPCPAARTTGLVECHWSAPQGARLTVPQTWTSGVYLVHLINAQHYESYMIFVVRDDNQPADFLYQQPVTTYQAYNVYPGNGVTGKSLYTPHSAPWLTAVGTQYAVKVSFDRPYHGYGDGEFSNPNYYEAYFVRWIERMGYNVTYATDLDLHTNGKLLRKYKALLVVGHAEYWSKEMYDAAWQARDAGVSLAFFGANDIYWQVRFEPSSSQQPNRVVVCYKEAANHDPVQGERQTTKWRYVGRPEQSLIGIEFGGSNAGENNLAAYVVADSKAWVFAGTSLNNGNFIPKLVGNEMDLRDSTYQLPHYLSYNLLSNSPFKLTNGAQKNANSTIYQAPSGAWVFAAGTLVWSWALDKAGYVNPDIQRLTQNVLDRFLQPVHTKPMAVALVNLRTKQP